MQTSAAFLHRATLELKNESVNFKKDVYEYEKGMKFTAISPLSLNPSFHFDDELKQILNGLPRSTM